MAYGGDYDIGSYEDVQDMRREAAQTGRLRMADKVYLKCSAKARQTQYGEVINIGIKVEDLAEFCRKHKNERGYLNLTISPRKEVGQYGDTHSIYLDTYEPKQRDAHADAF